MAAKTAGKSSKEVSSLISSRRLNYKLAIKFSSFSVKCGINVSLDCDIGFIAQHWSEEEE